MNLFAQMQEATRTNGGASGVVTPDGRFLDPVTTGHGYMVSLSPTADYTKIPQLDWASSVAIDVTPSGEHLFYVSRVKDLRDAAVLGELRTADPWVLMYGFFERIDLIHELRQRGYGNGLYVGMWRSNGLTCLDVSVHLSDLSFAKTLGRSGNQQAIFDIANMADINL